MAQAMVQNNQNKEGLVQMKKLVNAPAMIERAQNALGSEKDAKAFLTSVLSLYNDDKLLAKCNPNDVMVECLKAATLKLPVTKSLGFAYVIPYGNTPQFQLGYRGLIQLAQRSGQYKYLNAGCVYEGMKIRTEILSGMVEITGEPISDKVIGYFGYFELLNGYKKATYWTKEQVEAHAKKFSKAWSQASSPWHTQFDAMAIKTVLKSILSKYGVISIDFANVLAEDNVDEKVETEVAANANATPIEIPVEIVDEEPQMADSEEAGF